MHIAYTNKIECIKNKLVLKYYNRYSNTHLIWLLKRKCFQSSKSYLQHIKNYY